MITTIHPAAAKPKPIHLTFLDAIRGFAAVAVVLLHAYSFGIGSDEVQLSRPLRMLYHSFLHGHYAVDVFIVLSGYCLMIPVARGLNYQLASTFAEYVKRRAMRILPPYYIALAFSLAILGVLKILTQRGYDTGDFHGNWNLGGLLSHLVLLHNFSPIWEWQINGVFWSVATEWQIYFVFPLLLLPICRRAGLLWMFLAASVLSSVPYSVFHSHLLEGACPWYIGLFAAGMVAAEVTVRPESVPVRIRQFLDWKYSGLVIFGTGLVVCHELAGINYSVEDPVFGVFVASWLVVLARQALYGSTSFALRLLMCRPAVALGTFSYSIYLVHHPVLFLIRAISPTISVNTNERFLIIIPVQIVMSLCVAYGFYLCFERPFIRMKKRSRSESQTLPVAVTQD